MEISIVSPIYKGEKMLPELVRRITESVRTITDDYELILVNDMSPDNSWTVIEQLCALDKHVKGIELSRNFGQHYAITAGLANVKGNWVVVMDCDLQDRPEEIPGMYKKAKEGWDIVNARRVERQDKFLKKLSSKLFGIAYRWMSGFDYDNDIANFGVYKRCVIDEYNKMPEGGRDFEVLISFLGFRHTPYDVQHDSRLEGSSSYTLSTLLKLTFDVIIANSNKPLRLTVGLGFVMATLSFLLAFYNFLSGYMGLISVEGYTTTIFSIWFVGGLLLFVIGVLGLYIGKIFDQVKGRQLYIIRSKINF